MQASSVKWIFSYKQHQVQDISIKQHTSYISTSVKKKMHDLTCPLVTLGEINTNNKIGRLKACARKGLGDLQQNI